MHNLECVASLLRAVDDALSEISVSMDNYVKMDDAINLLLLAKEIVDELINEE